MDLISSNMSEGFCCNSEALKRKVRRRDLRRQDLRKTPD
jgi:hypothetical protein